VIIARRLFGSPIREWSGPNVSRIERADCLVVDDREEDTWELEVIHVARVDLLQSRTLHCPGGHIVMRRMGIVFAFAICALAPRAEAAPLKVGVTLHAYYSWVANIARGTDIEVRAILPGEVDAGSYQPRPGDIMKLADLDAIVVNGVGHDDFIQPMIEASGNKRVRLIEPNDATPLLGAKNGGTINSHTFISFSNAIQQTYAIARALGELRPELARKLETNAADYAKRLRAIKAKAAAALADAKTARVCTVHDGYAYLLQELGLDAGVVVEPAHGLVPSAGELGSLVKILKRERLEVVLTEESFPKPMLDVLRDSAATRIYVISHITNGAYTADKFEREMEMNVATLVKALVDDPSRS
jgi:zinc transport system substrate-binding protein